MFSIGGRFGASRIVSEIPPLLAFNSNSFPLPGKETVSGG